MNKKYIKPSSVSISIFTESDVADGSIGILQTSGSNDQQANRRRQPSDEWNDFEDEYFAEE